MYRTPEILAVIPNTEPSKEISQAQITAQQKSSTEQ